MSNTWLKFAHPSLVMDQRSPRKVTAGVNRWVIEEYRGGFDIYFNSKIYIYAERTRQEAEWEIQTSSKYQSGDDVIYRDAQGFEERVRL